jgi:Cytochrome P450
MRKCLEYFSPGNHRFVSGGSGACAVLAKWHSESDHELARYGRGACHSGSRRLSAFTQSMTTRARSGGERKWPRGASSFRPGREAYETRPIRSALAGADLDSARRLWRDPDAFDPSRFLPDAPSPPRYAYLPFGAGPRVCVGALFALTQATVVLAILIQAFRLEVADHNQFYQSRRSRPSRIERRYSGFGLGNLI